MKTVHAWYLAPDAIFKMQHRSLIQWLLIPLVSGLACWILPDDVGDDDFEDDHDNVELD